MYVVFSDLDGTLLDAEDYSFEAARPALDRLRQTGIPLVLTTSKTQAEVEYWRERIGNRDPFVFENGAAFHAPKGCFPFVTPELTVYGEPYARLIEELKQASRETSCAVRGFRDMTAEQVSTATNLPLDQAMLAKERQFDEPFEILDEARAADLLAAIERRGLRWTRGGRFFHIMGASDKARAVRELTALYRRAHQHLFTIGLGDSFNDVEFLRAVDHAVIVDSRHASQMRSEIPAARVTTRPGAAGWNEAILELIPEGPFE